MQPQWYTDPATGQQYYWDTASNSYVPIAPPYVPTAQSAHPPQQRFDFSKWLSLFNLRALGFDKQKEFVDQMTDFKRRNAILAVLHFGFWIAALVFTSQKKISRIQGVYNVPTIWTNNSIAGNYTGITGTKLDTCAADPRVVVAKWGSGQEWQYQIRAVRSTWLPHKWMFLLGFITLTVVAHAGRAFLADSYLVSVLKNNQPRWDRWTEYAFTSSAMIVIIAGTAGVNDVWLLWTLSVAQFGLIMYGYVIEGVDFAVSVDLERYITVGGQRLMGGMPTDDGVPQENRVLSTASIKMPWKIADKQLPASLLSKPREAGHEMLTDRMPLISGNPTAYAFQDPVYFNIMLWVKRVAFMTSTWIYLWIWFTIWRALIQVKNTFNCMNAGQKTIAFDIPTAIVWIEFGLFGLFAVAQYMLSFRPTATIRSDPNTYVQAFYAEWVYNWLSLFSKGALTFLLLWEASTMKVTMS